MLELLAELDSEVVDALCGLIGAEEAKATRALVIAEVDHRFIQGKVRALEALASALKAEFTKLHEVSRRSDDDTDE